MRTYVYVDAFNLYYGALKRRPHLKWLDLPKFFNLLLGDEYQIDNVRYFTALLKPFAGNPNAKDRQQVYIRALGTLPTVSIHKGSYQINHTVLPTWETRKQEHPTFVRVARPEEKGSDVNLATYLIHDAHRDLYDVAIVVTNDSDLSEPLRIVRHELGKVVGLINPFDGKSSASLRENATFVRQVRDGPLADAQLPDTLTDAHGAIHRPPSWVEENA